MWNFFKRRCQGSSDNMESNNNEQEKKKVNEDLVVFMRKRSDHEVPRYTARLKTYVDIQRKRRRAAAARRLSDHNCIHDKKGSTSPLGRKKSGKNDDQKEKAENRLLGPACMITESNPDPALVIEQQLSMAGPPSEHPASEDGRMSRRRGGGNIDDKTIRARSFSRSRSDEEPSEACCRRRRKRKKCGRRKRRRRSCRRKRRRRRSCRRKKRRRRRSCSRRRRRRSCRRRRRKRRRCR